MPLALYATPDGTDPKPPSLVDPDAFVLKQSRWYTLKVHETAQGVLEIEADNVDAKALIDELKKRTRSTGRAKGGKMMTAHKR